MSGLLGTLVVDITAATALVLPYMHLKMLSLVVLILSLSVVHGHSWVERLYVVKEGKMVGDPGFPRGNGTALGVESEFNAETFSLVQRTPTFIDAEMTHLLPPAGRAKNEILPSDFVCKETQRSINYTDQNKMLVVQPNDHIRLLYQENGHITRIYDDPRHNGTSGIITVVGIRHATSTDTLQDILDLSSTRATTLISNFDDGACYQANGTPEALQRERLSQRPRLEVEGPDLWCGQDFVIPAFLQPYEIYTLYWIWNFDGWDFTEIYTTCLDVIVSG